MAREAHEAVCEICGQDHAFLMPPRLLEDVIGGKTVLFAGAGISTETRYAYPSSFYEVIRAQLPDPDAHREAPFPEVMTQFCISRSRGELIQRIRERFDYGDAFYEIRNVAAAFHRELAPIPYFKTIVTTNWDTYFEEECGALPFVVPDDYAYWAMPGRRVFKIHGSITNLGTIVATTADYEACYRRLRTGILGSSLQHLLATNTVVFVGYSLRDPDFARLYRLLKRQLGAYMPKSYIVAPDDQELPSTFSGAKFIRTSGVGFLRQVKNHLVAAGLMIDESVLDEVANLHQRVRHANITMYDAMLPRDYPALIYAASYQNGLEHVFQRISVRSRFGEYMTEADVHDRVHGYVHMLERAKKRRLYEDVAYLEGVINAHLAMLVDTRDRRRIPLYWVFGSTEELTTQRKFHRELRKAAQLHKSAYRRAEKAVRGYGDLVVRHPPWLKVD
jgi:hypothetical protein